MKIIGVAKPLANKSQVLICQLAEAEVDKITGSAGKPHAAHRYRAGMDLPLNKIYNMVKWINENVEAIRAAMTETKVNVTEIEESLPLEA